MSDVNPYLGEIRLMSFVFPPTGWKLCDGQLLLISEYQDLYDLIGTIYGGDGHTTFALPDLRGRVPLHTTGPYVLGRRGGASQIALGTDQMPAHVHRLQASVNFGTSPEAENAFLADSLNEVYSDPTTLVSLDSTSLATAGESQAHTNLQPLLTISFCIALYGDSPSTTDSKEDS